MSLGSGFTFLAGVATVLSIVGAYLYQKKKEIIPKKWDEIGVVKKINLYPLRSGHKVELQRAECTNFGMKQTEEDEKVFQLRDRFLIVYSEKENEFRTARTYPKLSTIDVAVHDENHLAIDAPTMRTLYVEIPTIENGNEAIINFYGGKKVNAMDCGDEAALWFSRYILEKDSGLRLGYNKGTDENETPKTQNLLMDYYKQLSSSSLSLNENVTSILLVNNASVKDIHKLLGNSSFTVDNFKPNIVVDGPSLDPYSEDEWEWVKIGDVVLKNVKNFAKSSAFANDTINERRKSLQEFQQDRSKNGSLEPPVLGILLLVRKTGLIAVGDKVFVSKPK